MAVACGKGRFADTIRARSSRTLALGYFGVEIDERTFVPGKDARLGETRVEIWLTQSAKPVTRAKSPVHSKCGSRVSLKTEAESD
jgi:hypothetical protein